MTITGRTKIVGVIGDPVTHSRSPQMHNAAFQELGLDYVYVAFPVVRGDLPMALLGFQALRIAGINATIPHKPDLVPLVGRLSREAEIIGAVNTLVFTEDGTEGHNTDARGFLAALEEEGLDLKTGKPATILGAGGAARAIVVALALQGIEPIHIVNRTPERATLLAKDIAQQTGVEITGDALDAPQLRDWLGESQLLVNTTSAGMDPSLPLIVDPDWFPKGMIFYDIVYTPPETRLMAAARERGMAVLGGIGMLVHQGAIAFELWTGIEPPVETMRKALMSALGLTDE